MIVQFFFWYGIPDLKQLQNLADLDKDEKFSIWRGTKSIKPEMEIIPQVPSKEMIKIMALGDEELIFRFYSYKLQFVGDTFGRITPLKNYDYSKLYKWWDLLDQINPKSNILAYMVAYYFSATQTPEKQVPYVIKFLEEHADQNPEDKWWWYSQAIYNAKFKIDDTEAALRIARKLASLPSDLDIPIWTRQLEAFIYEDKGQFEKACDIVVNVVRDFGEDKLSQGEMNFIYNFITERLAALNEADEKSGIVVSPECRELMRIEKASQIRDESKRLKR
jgi:tetratricopeptide (TPR) repeat protein